MGLISATVTAVLMSMATPSAEPEAVVAFFADEGQETCGQLAAAMNADPDKPGGLHYYCE